MTVLLKAAAIEGRNKICLGGTGQVGSGTFGLLQHQGPLKGGSCGENWQVKTLCSSA